MNKEITANSTDEFENLTALEIWEKLYGKELNCKKNILEYIDITRLLKKGNVTEEQLEDTYNYIYQHIEGLKELIKPNTMMFLKNNLKSQLGKYVKEKDPKLENCFIEFFKRAYPPNNRRKDFTWVLMDINSITEEQIWTTLSYINKEFLKSNLTLDSNQKKDIVDVIKMLVKKNNIKYINNLRSLKILNDKLDISIVPVGKGFTLARKE